VAPGANLTVIVSYNATSSLVSFEKKTFVFTLKNVLAYYNAGVVAVNSGSNPTIAIYNASVVNFYNATGSLARFENKNTLDYCNAVVVAVNSKIVGLAPEFVGLSQGLKISKPGK
jgi:hypothetical protein